MTSPKVALVTGASGFIGQALCKRLRERRVTVRGLMRRSVPGPWDEFVPCDLGEGACHLEKAARGVDMVFHLAAKVHAVSEIGADDLTYRRVNVEGTRRILEACAAEGVRYFVFVSTVKAMGEGGSERVNEMYSAAPQTPYGCSKREAERLVLAAGQQHGMHVVNLRLPLVYGAGSRGNLSRMLVAVAQGRFPPLSDPGNKRSMVHVNDVVAALMLVVGHPRAAGQTYIITDGEDYSTREIYLLMCEALGRNVPAWTVPIGFLRVLAGLGDRAGRLLGKHFVFDSAALQKLTSSAWYDSRKIEQELGFQADQNLKGALPDMVQAMRGSGDRLRTPPPC